MATKSGDSKKWTNEEIIILIDSYKEESCLYAINSPNYHNKHLRNEALKRVGDAVRVFKPHVTDKDCASKFHTLRSQYNIENAKVKRSKKSGTGTDNVYKPSLWYFEHLMFLDTFFTPRKSRNSLEKNKNSETEFSQDSIHVITDGFTEDGHFNVFTEEEPGNESDEPKESDEPTFFESSALERPTIRQYTVGASTSIQSQRASPSPVRPSPSVSPAMSLGPVRPSLSISPAIPSSSGVSTACPPPSHSKAKRRKTTSDDAYAEAVQSLADSIRQPIVTQVAKTDSPPETVDGFLMFLGSILRNFQNEDLRLDVMNTCLQTCINARTADLQRFRNS
ncbi:uncharacterized protein [Temnothorax longispinosus]|uniref:uncharacterized protein n=1 Tax=Temnothorax longispinosus TaxID=300112 RepID=UPI003A9A4C5A